jgi:hypothetical protein
MTGHTLEPPLDAVAQRFDWSAAHEFHGSAPLYERLTHGVAADPELLALVAQAPAEQRRPTLFLAAVHYLLLEEAKHPLATYYPDLATAPMPSADPYPVFRAFCLERQNELVHVLTTRRVQTNEVGRCAALLPAFTLVSRLVGGRPVALVEVGASAGLNLLFDRYAYDYGSGHRAGDPGARVQLTSELRGARVPPLPDAMPRVASRVGIDLAPIDVQDADATRWLRACVWAEHQARAALVQRALTVARLAPPPLVAGNALDALPGVVASIPRGLPLCLFHSATLAYFAHKDRARFADLVAALAEGRDPFWLSSEGPAPLHESVRERAEEWRRRDQAVREAGRPGMEPVHWLVLTAFQAGRRTEWPLAAAAAHGTWLEWLDAASADA